jgi:hypothetical protein
MNLTTREYFSYPNRISVLIESMNYLLNKQIKDVFANEMTIEQQSMCNSARRTIFSFFSDKFARINDDTLI